MDKTQDFKEGEELYDSILNKVVKFMYYDTAYCLIEYNGEDFACDPLQLSRDIPQNTSISIRQLVCHNKSLKDAIKNGFDTEVVSEFKVK